MKKVLLEIPLAVVSCASEEQARLVAEFVDNHFFGTSSRVETRKLVEEDGVCFFERESVSDETGRDIASGLLVKARREGR